MKKISITIHPLAKKAKIEKKQSLGLDDIEYYDAYLINAPEKGKANRELIKILAKYFKLKKSQILILKGEKSRYKIVGIVN